MRNKSWLVEKYGEAAAGVIIENKKQLQSQRSGEFDPCWVMRNPDLPESEDTWIINIYIYIISLNLRKSCPCIHVHIYIYKYIYTSHGH